MRYRYAPFVTWLIVAAIAFGIGTWVRGCGMESRTQQIDAAEADRHRYGREVAMIQGIEGRKPGSPMHLVAEQVRALADPKLPGESIKEIVDLASVVKPLSGKQLERLGTMDRWLPYKTLAHMPAFEEFRALSERYGLSQALFMKRDLSARLTPPEAPPPPLTFFGDARFWLIVYLIACGSFVALWTLAMAMEREHPVRRIRWTHPAPLLAAVSAAPAVLPALVLYGIGAAVWRLFRDGEEGLAALGRKFRALGRWLLRSGYRLRILRRLPPPTATPIASCDARTGEAVGTDVPSPALERHGWIAVDPHVTLGRKHLLEACGIRIYPIAILLPRAMEAYAVPEPRIEAFEEALNLDGIAWDEIGTDVESVSFREYRYEGGDVTLDLRREHEAYRSMIESAIEEASAEDGGSSVLFYDTKMDIYPPAEALTAWRVIGFGAPAVTAEDRHARIYGVDLERPMTRLRPTEEGVTIRDPDGLPVAQVVGRNVYLLVDFLGIARMIDKPDLVPEWLARVLMEAFESRPVSPSQSDERLRELFEAERSTHRERYVGVCLVRVARQKEELARRLAECEASIREAGVKLTRRLLERKTLERRRTELEEGEWTEEMERLGREFDALSASKVVAEVRAYDDRVEVVTTLVRIRHADKTYLIGRFRLGLYADGEISIVNVENLGRRRDAHHPHVLDRTACLGNITESIAKYMAEREYAVVVALLHRYLQSYNPRSPYTTIDNWPTE